MRLKKKTNFFIPATSIILFLCSNATFSSKLRGSKFGVQALPGLYLCFQNSLIAEDTAYVYNTIDRTQTIR